jgi:arylsulfatase
MLRMTILLLAAVVASPAPGAEVEMRPNIVLIMADDLGFSDLGCYGGEIETPNLDRLAAGGLRFTQFYNCGRCCPTRAALLTGLYPHQTGVGLMEEDVGLPAYQGYLNRRCVTIAEVLKTAGYRTLMAGKWNVGYTRPHWPVDRGFDRYFGLLRGASNYFDPRVGPRAGISLFALDDRVFREFDEKFYATDAFTDRAIEFLGDGTDERPFFLYVAYTAPHSPLHAWPEDIAKYRGKYLKGWDELRLKRYIAMREMGIIDARVSLTHGDPQVKAWKDVDAATADAYDLKMAVYAAQVDRMDQGIGRIVKKLDELGATENTLVMFLSDNGGDAQPEGSTKDVPPGPKESAHIYGREWANLSNTPFRGYKHAMHEGGIATPLIMHWPRGIAIRDPELVVKLPADKTLEIRPSRLVHTPGHVIDLMTTCVDVAGAAYPQTINGEEILPLEGRSLLSGQPLHDALYWEHEGNRAVLTKDWKLVANYGRPWELYDRQTDRTELRDMADIRREVVADLAAQYDAWANRVGVVPWDDVRAKLKK